MWYLVSQFTPRPLAAPTSVFDAQVTGGLISLGAVRDAASAAGPIGQAGSRELDVGDVSGNARLGLVVAGLDGQLIVTDATAIRTLIATSVHVEVVPTEVVLDAVLPLGMDVWMNKWRLQGIY